MGYFGSVQLSRFLLQRGFAAIYLIAFLVVRNQFKPLLGEHGLLPVPSFLKRVRFRDAPSIFCWHYSDRLLDGVAWAGLFLSALALIGVSEAGPFWLSATVWLTLWVFYLSIINVGQTFYAFGWESMLVEAGFFAAFLGPSRMQPSIVPILILRWMLFRTEFGAGMIKLRHDRCWRDLTCLFYHYETQPLPNPLSWYFHRLPKIVHRAGVLGSHFVQVGVPFALFAPQPFASLAGALIIFHQLWLIVSGNYSWLNWITVVLGFTALDDKVLRWILPIAMPQTVPRTVIEDVLMLAVGLGTILLSIQPARNLLSKSQLMNYSYNPFHLVNAYGAFGSVTKERYEIVIEGTADPEPLPGAQWEEYEFKGKPGNPMRRPPQVAPYHLRLDWLVWFLPFSVAVHSKGIRIPGYDRWFMRFIQRLLENDRPTLKLLRRNPFETRRPTFVRALFYRYRYSTAEERRRTGAWWIRKLVDVYLEPVSLADCRRGL
ncbi:MAG TPA: lipase maturation factor family protein [Terriglobia bacterium]|jgi:hypothetical protein